MIKATVDHGVKNTKFPKLMKSNTDDAIVFFNSERAGQVVFGANAKKVGYYSADWCPDSFSDFNGSILLENVKD